MVVSTDLIFAVVLSQKTPDDKYHFSLQNDWNKKKYEEDSSYLDPCYSKAIVNPGESFFYVAKDNKWYDISDEDVKESLLKIRYPDNYDYLDLDNFPIKAYMTESEEKTEEVKKVPLTGNGDCYASSNDNFAAITSSGKISDQKLDFSNVIGSGIDPSGLKMTAIKGSKFKTVGKVRDRSSVKSSGGVKVKVNKKTLIATVSCRSSGSAAFTMEDGNSYSIAFSVEKPHAVESAKKLKSGGEKVSKSIKDLFATTIDSGTLSIKKDDKKQASLNDNRLTINPANKGKIKIGYKYLNKKYKMTIRIE